MTTNIFNSNPTKPGFSTLGFILAVLVIYPMIFVGLAWLITNAITEIVANGVSFWPILALVIATWVIAGWVGKKK